MGVDCALVTATLLLLRNLALLRRNKGVILAQVGRGARVVTPPTLDRPLATVHMQPALLRFALAALEFPTASSAAPIAAAAAALWALLHHSEKAKLALRNSGVRARRAQRRRRGVGAARALSTGARLHA